MARFLKNPDLARSGLAARLPLVPSSSYGDAPTDGLIRFNQDNNKVEFYYNNTWNQVAKIGTVPIIADTFTTADGVVTYGPMSYAYDSGAEPNVLVFVGGVQQKPIINYTFDGTVTLNLNPTSGTAGQTITVLHNFNSTDAV
jgi:hypothetical protein